VESVNLVHCVPSVFAALAQVPAQVRRMPVSYRVNTRFGHALYSTSSALFMGHSANPKIFSE
jgi:hypothetical protein